jgi:hypothetical protein
MAFAGAKWLYRSDIRKVLRPNTCAIWPCGTPACANHDPQGQTG